VLVATSITKNVFSEQACRGRNVLGAGVEYLMEEPAWLAIPPHVPAAESIARFRKLETPPNHFPGYGITIRFPECTSVCPKRGLPDYGAITIEYERRKFCLELKACKMHLLGYRSLGIFYRTR
jgi:hypothetical protein